MAISEDSGRVNIYETKKKIKLRNFDNHKKAVHSLAFHDTQYVFSGGDDRVFFIE